MSNYIENAAEMVAEEKLRLAASNLKHLIKVQSELVTVEAVAQTLRQTMVDAHAKNPDDICEAMAVNARILDGMFHHYIDDATRTIYSEEKHQMALKFHNQMIRTMQTWKQLKTSTYIKHKIVKHLAWNKNDDERTEQIPDDTV